MIRNYIDRSLHHSDEPDLTLPAWLVILSLFAAGLGAALGSWLVAG